MAHQMLMSILNQSSGPSNWVYMDTETNDPGTTVSKIDSSVSDPDSALISLEATYPVANQEIGDSGCVYDDADNFYIFEAQ